MLTFHDDDNKNGLDIALSHLLAETILEAIKLRGKAFIALSGGRTPVNMLNTLSQHNLPWEKVMFTLVDDRWVEETHPDSNTGLIRTAFLKNYAKSAHFISLKNEAPTPYEGQPVCEKILSQFPKHLDAVVLGMGEDGHTASLFPRAPELETALTTSERCAAINPQTAPHLRITLSGPYIAQSSKLILHITGEKKKSLLQKLLAPTAPQPYAPIRRVLDLAKMEKYVFWAE